jgi:hypothetical protein
MAQRRANLLRVAPAPGNTGPALALLLEKVSKKLDKPLAVK